MKKVNCILLVDDNEADNYYHSFIINDCGACNQIKTALSGEEALIYITRTIDSALEAKYPVPDFIFLDINMPRMNGFEFLDELKKKNENLLRKIIIIMLTSSTDPNEEVRALNTGVVKEFINKPLETEMLNELLQKYSKTA
jgi:CheY-like chemotaxis protein